MIKALSRRFVSWQVARNLLKEEDIPVYQYAYELLINQVLNLLIAVLIAIIWGAPIPVFVFLFSYIPLRSYCGGYHARTNGGCMVVSALLIYLTCTVVAAFPAQFAAALQFGAMVVSGILIYTLAPVADSNKPLEQAEIVRYKRYGRRIWLLETAAGLTLTLLIKVWQAGLTIGVGHLILSSMLCLGAWRNHRVETKL